MITSIIKSSGEQEPFSQVKFTRSLRKAGVQEPIIAQLLGELATNNTITSTHELYTYAFNRLKEINRPTAARYSLKQALYELGPTGFGFERFVGEIFKEQGYSILVDQIVQGVCVDHEVDLIIERSGTRSMVECKFHNRAGTKTDVRDALYTKARFDDLSAKWSHSSTRPELACDGVWLVTNTQFTTKAITYGICAQVHLLGWNYPHDAGIAFLIDSLHLHPITALTGLSKEEKATLVSHDIFLCRDLVEQPDLLEPLSLAYAHRQLILDECKELCAESKS